MRFLCVLCVNSFSSGHVYNGHFARSTVSNITEDASTSHPCERGAGLRIATSGGWRRKFPRLAGVFPEVCDDSRCPTCVRSIRKRIRFAQQLPRRRRSAIRKTRPSYQAARRSRFDHPAKPRSRSACSFPAAQQRRTHLTAIRHADSPLRSHRCPPSRSFRSRSAYSCTMPVLPATQRANNNFLARSRSVSVTQRPRRRCDRGIAPDAWSGGWYYSVFFSSSGSTRRQNSRS